MSSPDFRTDWLASTISQHSDVTGATALQDGLVRITRETAAPGQQRRRLPPITAAPLGNYRIDKHLVEMVLANATPTVIVLVPKSGHYDWDARELAIARGSTVFTVKELYTFMHEADLRSFHDKKVAYIRERLNQHSKVIECDMICEASLRIRRVGTLSDVVVSVEHEYEFSEEAAVRAISRHPDAQIILNSNPNGTATMAAYSHARDAQVPIYNLSELMGAINHEGTQLLYYEATKRR
jgi:hypothetical protein